MIPDTAFIHQEFTSMFSPGDTSKVFFDKRRLRFEGDTLYLLGEDGLKTDTRYVLAKNKR